MDTGKIAGDCLETEAERNRVRRLIYFRLMPSQAARELRSHYLCVYSFEPTGEYSIFYNMDRILGGPTHIASRRLSIFSGILNILEIDKHLFHLEMLERM
jgi:arginyl-tRNA synthetase